MKFAFICGLAYSDTYGARVLIAVQSMESIMAIFATSLVLAAAGYSLLYLLFGGGLGGAILIFIVAKMLGK